MSARNKWPNGKPGSKTGNVRTWPAAWSRLADAAGGVDALAALLYTSRRHLTRWALHGVEPSGQAAAIICQTAKSLGVRDPLGVESADQRTGVLFPLQGNETLKARFNAAVRARAGSRPEVTKTGHARSRVTARSAKALPKDAAGVRNHPSGRKRTSGKK